MGLIIFIEYFIKSYTWTEYVTRRLGSAADYIYHMAPAGKYYRYNICVQCCLLVTMS